MRVVICYDKEIIDDEKHTGLEGICVKRGLDVTVYDSNELLHDIDNNLFNFNIVILNSHFYDKNEKGILLGKLINEKYPKCQIIFCVDDYNSIPAVYQVDHCFLFKEHDVDMWADIALEKARRNYEKSGGKQYLEFMYDRKPVILSQSTIKYIEREQRVVNIHTETKKYPIYVSIKEIVDQLDDTFARCQGGFIVNMGCIESVSTAGIQLNSGEIIPVGKTYKKNFNNAYKKYIKVITY